ncbi:hypothetical protein GQ602_006981 [Ophiocordyceps camponoti-floridani]|uniref:Uncharacterized protein n=1 Tax=Ophiocordyceps camponoti-floridani TaxID=2030778 RepID=A0A8H4Q0L3_9HYPO|nr:hypothetical protein GQ602_006981 [Ophiocordyceps camponoti-floridani]
MQFSAVLAFLASIGLVSSHFQLQPRGAKTKNPNGAKIVSTIKGSIGRAIAQSQATRGRRNKASPKSEMGVLDIVLG